MKAGREDTKTVITMFLTKKKGNFPLGVTGPASFSYPVITALLRSKI